jgi:hypothetical protein
MVWCPTVPETTGRRGHGSHWRGFMRCDGAKHAFMGLMVNLCSEINHGDFWLVGTFLIFPYIGNNHPNWPTQIFQRGSNHQPDEYWRMSPVPTSRFESLHAETSHSNIVLEFWQLCPDLYRTDFYESTGSESERVITPHIYME